MGCGGRAAAGALAMPAYAGVSRLALGASKAALDLDRGIVEAKLVELTAPQLGEEADVERAGERLTLEAGLGHFGALMRLARFLAVSSSCAWVGGGASRITQGLQARRWQARKPQQVHAAVAEVERGGRQCVRVRDEAIERAAAKMRRASQ